MEKDSCDKNSGCSTCGTANQCDEKLKQEHEDRLLRETLTAIRHKVFVLSGKGGVGKTTIAVNLAASLAARGYETGILDIDIHGPNVPKMLGIEGWKLSSGGKKDKISPFRPFPHLKVISMAGLLPDNDEPVIWRGPLKMIAIRQFLQDVDWGPLDFLIVDSPPGTGDEPLSCGDRDDAPGGRPPGFEEVREFRQEAEPARPGHRREHERHALPPL